MKRISSVQKKKQNKNFGKYPQIYQNPNNDMQESKGKTFEDTLKKIPFHLAEDVTFSPDFGLFLALLHLLLKISFV